MPNNARALRVVALLLFIAVVSLRTPLSAQISPGKLSRSHSDLEGAIHCVSCHKPGSNATLKCLDCHTEIASRLQSGHGYHARVAANPGDTQHVCATCHSEHNGLDFNLIKWQPSQQQFDHTKTGWPLQGKHAGLECAKCHNAAKVTNPGSIKIKDKNRTFLGVSPQCVTCHKDEHKGQLGENCQQCHNTTDWKTVTNFDHSKARFKLTGAHTKVQCAKCHTPTGPEQKPQWRGIAFDRCESCHKDPHKGSFTQPCQSCHNTTVWRGVAAAALSGKFDHSKTKFPLLGKHVEVSCLKCHQSGDFKREIAFQRCADCHKPDPHSGQFAKRADGGECASCHTVDGWKPSKFTVADHQKTAYPLQGKHETVVCAKCHIPAGKATIFKVKFARCNDCHLDPHAGQFKAPPLANRCDACHTVQGYKPSTFTLAKHKDTKFPLVGAHIAVACSDCHKKELTPNLQTVAIFRFKDMTCTGCHQNPHGDQFKDRMARVDSTGKPAGCTACHKMSSWRDMSGFDHSTTNFQLLGSHRAVACIDCHKPANLETKMARVDFHAAPKECESCHADPHAAQFVDAVAHTTRCAGCHNTNKWKPSTFDHNTRTAFKLEGVHANVRCARCHKTEKEVDGKPVLFYKPTPKECAACHGPDVLQRSSGLH